VRGKVVPKHEVSYTGGPGGTVPHILNFGTKQRLVVNFTP
jgi:hypothetical protein